MEKRFYLFAGEEYESTEGGARDFVQVVDEGTDIMGVLKDLRPNANWAHLADSEMEIVASASKVNPQGEWRREF